MPGGTGIDVWTGDGKAYPWFARGGIVRPGDHGTIPPAELPACGYVVQRHIG